MIIGAQKGGTSALFDYLSRHPEIRTPKEKEINFFWQDQLYSKGLEWYYEQFPESLNEDEEKRVQTFEATPHYLHSEKAAERIWKFNKNMKFILLLREPLSRAWSQFQMYQRKRKDKQGLAERVNKYEEPVKGFFKRLADPDFFINFEEALENEYTIWSRYKKMVQPGLFWQGLYAMHIQSYYNYFESGQFIFIESEMLKLNPVSVMKELEKFLGLNVYHWENEKFDLINTGGYISAIIPDRKNIFAKANAELFQLLGKKYNW